MSWYDRRKDLGDAAASTDTAADPDIPASVLAAVAEMWQRLGDAWPLYREDIPRRTREYARVLKGFRPEAITAAVPDVLTYVEDPRRLTPAMFVKMVARTQRALQAQTPRGEPRERLCPQCDARAWGETLSVRPSPRHVSGCPLYVETRPLTVPQAETPTPNEREEG
jgi:hypothetical protein